MSNLAIFQEQFNNYQIKHLFKKVFQGFVFYLITDSINNIQEIEKLSNESKIIIIDIKQEQDEQYFIICLDKAIIFALKKRISLLFNFFQKEKGSTVLLVSDKIKDESFIKIFKINICNNINDFIKEDYEKAIESFIENLSIFKDSNRDIVDIWPLILPSFSNYIIYKSYQNLEQRKIEESSIEIKEMNQNDFIPLQFLSLTDSSRIQLIYHIEREQLFVLKFFHSSESNKLFEREYNNYINMKYHPSIPHFYGKIKIDNDLFLIIEYIKGKNLSKIHTMSLKIEEKVNLMFEIMIIIEFLNIQSFIYRDLKPSNFIVDDNKRIVLIDFDRMINCNSNIKEQITLDFNNSYQAPEVLNATVKKYTCKEDIYSVGLLIYFIFFERNPCFLYDKKTKQSIYSFHEFPDEYKELKIICEKCTQTNPENRPFITILIDLFYRQFLDNITDKIIQFDINDLLTNYKTNNFFPFWKLLYPNQYFTNQFIKFNSVASINYHFKKYIELYCYNLNFYHLISQYLMGEKYYHRNYFLENIKTLILYLSKTVEKKNPLTIFILYEIFSKGNFITREKNQFNIGYKNFTIDMKTFQKYKKEADNNNAYAQSILGYIYYSGMFNFPCDINKSIHYLKLASNQNNADAQCLLGQIYYEGKYVKRNINKAIYYYTLSANQNNAYAQNKLGSIYYKDKNVRQDIDKAIYYYTLSANQNIADSQYYLGWIYAFEQNNRFHYDIRKAIYYFQLLADQNDAVGQYLIAFFYSNSAIGLYDIKKAFHYLTLSANQNYIPAMKLLAFNCFKGKFIPRDIGRGIHYLTLAAQLNDLESQFQIGMIYSNGKYIPPIINRAIYFLTLAANQNHIGAQLELGFIYIESKLIAQNIYKGIYYLKLAANQNDRFAQYNIGKIYFEGKHISRNIEKGIYYLTLAANQNHADAQFYLGNIYFTSCLVPRDINKAIYYYSLASNNNIAEAQANLGFIYSTGEYIPKNIKKATHYISLAANQNNSFALALHFFLCENNDEKNIHYLRIAAENNNHDISQFILGYLYLQGKCVQMNISKAIYYFNLAANQDFAYAQYFLGLIYFFYIDQGEKKGAEYLEKASKNHCKKAHSLIGILYHEGKYVKQDINKAIHYYKEGSSFNDPISKNNLGIIYYKGFENKISANIDLSIEYFEEVIRQNNLYSKYSMLNLGIIYIYDKSKQNLNESINLLIKSYNQGLKYVCPIICIALIKKIGFVISNIKKEIEKYNNISKSLKEEIVNIILENNLCIEKVFDKVYDYYENFLIRHIIHSNMYTNDKMKDKNINSHPINSDFYEGFGIDI